MEADNQYMGIRMMEGALSKDMVEATMYQRAFGMNTIQIYI